MIPPINLSTLRPTLDHRGSRERTLKAIHRYKEADERLKRICAEQGIAVPELIC